MTITPNQWTILEALQEGPRWMRSFQTVKPLVENLIEQELIERCRPNLGRARNMVRLTDSGCAALEIEPTAVPAMRDEPKRNSKAFAPVLGEIKADASPLARKTCEDFVGLLARGFTSREAVAELAAVNDVQRPAIWKRLRDGGVIAPYAPRQKNGKGCPRGGGSPGYTEVRRERSATFHHRIDERQLPLRIDRDPCPRCGVRADIGCAHSRAPLGMMM